ncbi:Nuclear transcription factor Y subunit B-6 [Linum grandiflorum]
MPRNNRRAPPPPPQHGRPPLQPKEKDMPVSNIMRIMKRALPPNAKITNASKETVQKYVTQYISLVTVEASARCKRDMRTTLTADDLLWALGHLGFEGFVQPLTEYRDMYRKNNEEALQAQAAASPLDPTLLAKPPTPDLKMLVGDDRNFLSLGGLYEDAGASSSGPVLVDYFKDRVLGSGSGEGSSGAGGGEDAGASQSGLPKF